MFGDNEMDFIITALKLIAVTLTGAFGALGLLTDYRNEETKEITHYGKIALYGIIISTVVALSTQALEFWGEKDKAIKAAIEAKEASERMEITLNNINRLLQPLGKVKVAFKFTISAEDPGVAEYIAMLRNELKKAEKEYFSSGKTNFPNGIKIIGYSGERKISSYSIWPKTSLSPSFAGGADPLKIATFTIDWYATRVDIDQAINRDIKSDLSLHVIATDYDNDPKLHINYDPDPDSFSLNGIFPTASINSDNGVIASVLDVPGSTLIVRQLNKEPFSLKSMTLKVAEGKSFRFKNFIHRVVNDLDVYVHEFPVDITPNKALKRDG